MRLTFIRAFTYDIDDRNSRTFPAGWTGEVDDEIAELAIEADAVEEAEKPKATKKPKAATPPPAAPGEDAPVA